MPDCFMKTLKFIALGLRLERSFKHKDDAVGSGETLYFSFLCVGSPRAVTGTHSTLFSHIFLEIIVNYEMQVLAKLLMNSGSIILGLRSVKTNQKRGTEGSQHHCGEVGEGKNISPLPSLPCKGSLCI